MVFKVFLLYYNDFVIFMFIIDMDEGFRLIILVNIFDLDLFSILLDLCYVFVRNVIKGFVIFIIFYEVKYDFEVFYY